MNRRILACVLAIVLTLTVVVAPGTSSSTWKGSAGTNYWHTCQPCDTWEYVVTSNWTAPCTTFAHANSCGNGSALPGPDDDVVLDESAPSTVFMLCGVGNRTQIHSLTVRPGRAVHPYAALGNTDFEMYSLDNQGSIFFNQTATYGASLVVGGGGTINTGTIRPLTGDGWDRAYAHNLVGVLTNYGIINGHSGFLSIDGSLITQAAGSIEGRGIQVTGPAGSRFLMTGGQVADSVNIASKTFDVQNGVVGRAYVNSDTLLLNGAATFNRTNFYGKRVNVAANGVSGKIYLLADGLDVAHQASTGCTLTVWNRNVDLVNDIPPSSPVEIVTTSGFSSTLNAANNTRNSGLLRFASAGTVAPVLSLGGTFTNAVGGVIRSDVPVADIRNGTMVSEGLVEVPAGRKLNVYSPSFVMNGGAIIAAPDSAAGASAFRMQSGTTFVYNAGSADTVTLATGASGDVRSGAGPGTIYVFNRNATFVQNQSPLVAWFLGTGGTGTATLTVAAGAENRGKLRIMARGSNDPAINLLGGFTNQGVLQCDALGQITGGTIANTGTVVVSPAARLLVHSPTFNMNGGSIVAGADTVNGASSFRMQSGSTFVYSGGHTDTVTFTTGSSADVRSGAGPGTLAVFNRNVTLVRNESPTVTMLLGTGGTGTATLTVSGGAINKGRIAFNGKGTSNPVLSFAGAATNAAEGVISSDVNAGDFAGTGILTNIGTLKTESATAELRAGSRLGNYASGTLTGGRYDLLGKLRITGAAITNLAAEAILQGSSAGILNQTSGANALAALSMVRQSGALRLFAGHRFNTTAASLTDSGLVEVADACTLQVANGTGSLTIQGAGVLSGSGLVLANVTNHGTATPGASAGRLAIEGTWSQSSTGKLVIEIGGDVPGTGFDLLAVSGAATLGGAVEIRFINGYVPTSGTTFDFLTSASVTGLFTSVTVDGGSGSVTYAAGKASFISGPGSVAVGGGGPDAGQPAVRFGIESITPNPARSPAMIRYGLSHPEAVRLEVYDAAGRLVRTLSDGVEKEGFHEVGWNGRDEANNAVASGMYFARLSAPARVSNRKFLLLR